MNVPLKLKRRLGEFLHLCRLGLLFALLLSAGGVQQAQAQGMIYYQATDLADTTPGQDLWRYSYTVTGFNLQVGQGFTVFFSPLDSSHLQSPPPVVNADWDAISVQPDNVLHAPGFYDALALRNSPSLTAPFSLTFVRQGQGTPGAQPFTIYNTDFSTLMSGQTVVVPEPTTVALFLAGLAALALVARRNRQ